MNGIFCGLLRQKQKKIKMLNLDPLTDFAFGRNPLEIKHFNFFIFLPTSIPILPIQQNQRFFLFPRKNLLAQNPNVVGRLFLLFIRLEGGLREI